MSLGDRTLLALGLAVAAPMALVRCRERVERSAARDLGVVALLSIVGAGWFVTGDDVHALLVSAALAKVAWAGWRGGG